MEVVREPAKGFAVSFGQRKEEKETWHSEDGMTLRR